MSMKPCIREQDILFAIHGEAGLWRRLSLALHCRLCPDCRRRRIEFLRTTRLLAALGPRLDATAPKFGTARRARIVLCSALVALAAMAMTHYFTGYGPNLFFGKSEASAAEANATPSHCGVPEDPPVTGRAKKFAPLSEKLKPAPATPE